MAPSDDEDFEQAARTLRIELEIDDRFCPDLIFVLDELKRRGKIEGYLRVPDEAMKDDASYDSDQRLLRIRESVFRVLDHPNLASRQEFQRARFTIAHEVGHVIWSHHGKYFRGPTTDAATGLSRRLRLRESEANRFAAAFLIPSYLAKPNMTAEHIGELFHVNVSVASLRKTVLERIDRRTRDVRRLLPKGVADWLRGQREKGYNTLSLDQEEARRRAEQKKKSDQDDDGRKD